MHTNKMEVNVDEFAALSWKIYHYIIFHPLGSKSKKKKKKK